MDAMLQPVMAMIILTIVVWVVMFVKRLSVSMANNIDPQDLATPQQITALLDDKTNAPANCFKNMLEVPVLFYITVMIIVMAGMANSTLISLAWVFVGFRAVQAFIHCTYNKVMHRFITYLIASLSLWAMVAMVAVRLF